MVTIDNQNCFIIKNLSLGFLQIITNTISVDNKSCDFYMSDIEIKVEI